MARSDDSSSKRHQEHTFRTALPPRPPFAGRTSPKASRDHATRLQGARGGTLGAARNEAGSSCSRSPDAKQQIKPRLAASGKEQHPVATFLRDIGLEQHITPLMQGGFDDMETLLDIEDEHMKALGMPPGHMVKLKKRLRELKASASGSPAEDSTSKMFTVVQRSWLHVQELGAEVVGELLCKKIFELAPETKQLFSVEVRNRHRDWSTSEAEEGWHEDNLYSSPAIRRLFAKTVNAVGSAVAGLQDMNKLVPQLTSLGMRHFGYGVTEEYLAIAGKALVRVLAEGLGDLFTPEVEHAWTIVYGFISATMVGGIKAKKAEIAALGESLFKHSCQPAKPMVGSQIAGGRESYRIKRHLHKAIFGDVYHAVGLISRRSFALKVLEKEVVDRFDQADQIHDDHFCELPLCEVQYKQIMTGLDHVMQLEEHFTDEVHHYLVSELATGGDLLEALKLRPDGFDEKLAQCLIRDAAKGLANLHARGLAMQDVSLENMLLYVRKDGHRKVSVCDPGQAVLFSVDPVSGAEKPVQFDGFVGKEFRPPELYSSCEYLATKVDAWCLGYSAFFLLVAERLFQSTDAAVQDPDWILFNNGGLSKLFEEKEADSILSSQAKDFVSKLLELDPQHRMSVTAALSHPWLVERNLGRRTPSRTSSGASMSTIPGQSSPTYSGDGDSVTSRLALDL